MENNFIKRVLLMLSAFICFYANSAVAEEVVKMGIFPRKPALETIKAYEPLAKYLSSKIGKRVELVVAKDFQSFWEGVKKKEYDLVHYNQYQYVKSHKELDYDVILMNEEFGSPKVNAAIIVRKDSGINSVTDLKGKKILFGGNKQAMQSYIGAVQILTKNGLKSGQYAEDFAVNPPNVALAVFNKMADAGGVGEVLLQNQKIKEKIDVTQLKVLARGDDLPMLCWAVKKEMNKDLAQMIQKTMIGLKNDEAGKNILKDAEATAFVSAADKDYDIVRKIVKESLNEEY
jgi:phosphonate transport system substrate-binding protein